MSWEFKFGIEEEYFVNDAAKRDIARGQDRRNSSPRAARTFSDDIQPEMLEPQIEIATTPCFDFAEARTQLSSPALVRRGLAREHDLSIMASGTHPLAVWSRVRPTAPAALRQGDARPADGRQP